MEHIENYTVRGSTDQSHDEDYECTLFDIDEDNLYFVDNNASIEDDISEIIYLQT